MRFTATPNLSGQLARHYFHYQYDGLDGYFHLAAQPHGSVLVVSFTDTNDQPRTAVEAALRESQACERQARAEAEQEKAAKFGDTLAAGAYIVKISQNGQVVSSKVIKK